jgi:hypothetical protein
MNLNASAVLTNITFNSSALPVINARQMLDATFIRQYCGQISLGIFAVFSLYWVAFTLLYVVWLWGDKAGIILTEERYHYLLERLERSYGVLGGAALLYLAFYVF